MRIAVIYLVAIAAAEVVTTFFLPLLGIVGHIIILVAVIFHSALSNKYPHRQLLLCLALVPLVRIMSLTIPLANIPQVWWYPIIYAPLIVAAFVVMRVLGYRAEDVGLSFKFSPLQVAVALSGLAFGVAEYFILREEAIATGAVLLETPILSPLFLLMFTGFGEELLFRGVLQRSAFGAFRWWGIVYVNAIFAILHMLHTQAGLLSQFDVLFVFGIAMFFGWVVKKEGSLLGVTLSHGITNIVLFLIAPSFF